jgi:hypothetical protein
MLISDLRLVRGEGIIKKIGFHIFILLLVLVWQDFVLHRWMLRGLFRK